MSYNVYIQILCLIFLIKTAHTVQNKANFTLLNHKLQLLSEDFIELWKNTISEINLSSLSKQEKGSYLYIAGKLHLYRMAENSSYLLAYHYLKTAAEQYQCPNAYYYLALMQYMKITPNTALKNSLVGGDYGEGEKEEIQDYVEDLDTQHLHNIEYNLYLASLLGNNEAKLTMGYLLKEGISVIKNSFAALGYYLSEIRETKVEFYEFTDNAKDDSNFQFQLYQRKKADLSEYGQSNVSPLTDTLMFDAESKKAYEDIAMNYLLGSNGMALDEEKAAQMFMKMEDVSNKAKLMLGFMHLRGRGVEVDYSKARSYFEKLAENKNYIAIEALLMMKYYNMGYKDQKAKALEQMKVLYEYYEEKSEQNTSTKKKENPNHIIHTPALKYLIGSLVLNFQIPAKQPKKDKNAALALVQQSAQEGSTMGLIMMGLFYVDGAQASFSAEQACILFSRQAKTHRTFKRKAQLSKIGIKRKQYMFSFIKYIQLMMIGQENAHINAFYLVEIYGNQIFQFSSTSWQKEILQNNRQYQKLVSKKVVRDVGEKMMEDFNSNQRKFVSDGVVKKMDKQTINQHIGYIRKKIMEVGIIKHDLSILKFYKYKENKNIATLEELANQSVLSDQVLQSRFLLGRYFQHKERKSQRAIDEYRRATKSVFLANLIYYLEGGKNQQNFAVFNDLIVYLIFVIVGFVICLTLKNRRESQILKMQQERTRMQEEGNQQQNQLFSNFTRKMQQNNEETKKVDKETHQQQTQQKQQKMFVQNNEIKEHND